VKTTQRRGANHGLHLVLSLLTCGLWAVTGWPIAAVLGRRTVTHSSTPVDGVWAGYRSVPGMPPPLPEPPVVSLSGTHYLNPHTNTWERMR
jgi:hypothetical protein